MQPARDWWRGHTSPFWSTLLHGVYFFYYLILAVPALFFLLRGDWPAFRRFTRNVVCTFCVCFLVFVLYPVAGPYYVFEHPTGLMVDNLPAHMVYAALASGSSFGAAFPSSHVAATTAAGLATFKGNRTLGWILLVPVLLMPIATVYTQMHYAWDAIVGVLVGTGGSVGRRQGSNDQRKGELKTVRGEEATVPFTLHRSLVPPLHLTVSTPFMPSAWCGVQWKLYVPAGKPRRARREDRVRLDHQGTGQRAHLVGAEGRVDRRRRARGNACRVKRDVVRTTALVVELDDVAGLHRDRRPDRTCTCCRRVPCSRRWSRQSWPGPQAPSPGRRPPGPGPASPLPEPAAAGASAFFSPPQAASTITAPATRNDPRIAYQASTGLNNSFRVPTQRSGKYDHVITLHKSGVNRVAWRRSPPPARSEAMSAPPGCESLGRQCQALDVLLRIGSLEEGVASLDHEATWLLGHTERITFGEVWTGDGELYVDAVLHVPCRHLKGSGDGRSRCAAHGFEGRTPRAPGECPTSRDSSAGIASGWWTG